MKILEYFSTENKEYWLSRIKECDWRAGQFFYQLLKNQKLNGMSNIYISTNHYGLYEKYGYEFFKTMKDMGGEDSRVYVKHL